MIAVIMAGWNQIRADAEAAFRREPGGWGWVIQAMMVSFLVLMVPYWIGVAYVGYGAMSALLSALRWLLL